jgi:THAP domain
MIYCSVKDCKNNSSCENVRLFSFPKTKEREQWIEFTKKDKWLPTANSKICSDHFSPHLIKGQKLQIGAVPSLRGEDHVVQNVYLGKFAK